ncbi:MAG: sulfotransferase family 2 domain-containing protein [Synechococcus sp.]
MIVSLKHRFVFLCTPKCASSSIHAALAPYGEISIDAPPPLKHTNFRDYTRFIKPYLEDKIDEIPDIGSLETTCIVREPVDWLYSWYRFRSRYKALGQEQSTADIEFPEFIEAYMSPNPPIYADMGFQYDFVRNEAREIGVDKIFAFENIDDFVAYMSDKVGMTLELKTLNTSPKKRYESSTAAFVELVRNKLRRELKIRPSTADAAANNYGLSDALLSDLRSFMADDFRVHEMAKEGKPLQAVAAA